MLLAASFVGGVVLFSAGDAEALRVTMKRIVFEDAKRTEILTVVNNSSEEQAFRLGWRSMYMTENKSVVPLKDGEAPPDGYKTADDMVRFAPRRVLLAPGASQQVRLMLRRPKDLPDGEYRSHFWIQPEAESVKFDPEKIPDNPKGPSVQIKMLTGMTLPVFVRSGEMKATVGMTDLSVVQGKKGQVAKFSVTRTGNRSLYGDIRMFCSDGGAEVLNKEIKGIAVYTEVSKRNLAYELAPPKSGEPACNKVHVQYVAPDDDPLFHGGVMAEATTP